MTRALWWIRRDFRLQDNPALDAALSNAEQVIPVFIRDPFFEQSDFVGDKRIAFMLAGLQQLDAELRERDSWLVYRKGKPLEVLAALVNESQASTIYAQADYSPYARRRDAAVREKLPLTLTGGLSVYPPETIRKSDGDPYVVFSYYKRRWLDLPPRRKGDILPAPEQIPPLTGVEGVPIPDKPSLPESAPFPAGTAEAQARLKAFTEGVDPPIYHYDEQRDLLAVDGTSRLSPYLRWGMIAAGQVAAAAFDAIRSAPNEAAREQANRWLIEIIWRDFYLTILYHYPRVRSENFKTKYDGIQWQNDANQFSAWCEGQTGFPVVDAAMRQMLATGWMHNRARMIVASFLTKDLLIDWRWGERAFMQHLLDGDVAANNGGWQWAAGTGTDAAPYFRIFNPWTQGEKHDPQGVYIRQWVPELADVPDKYIHEPYKMPDDVQQAAGCRIGDDYPHPIVDHKAARERTLVAYKAAKG